MTDLSCASQPYEKVQIDTWKSSTSTYVLFSPREITMKSEPQMRTICCLSRQSHDIHRPKASFQMYYFDPDECLRITSLPVSFVKCRCVSCGIHESIKGTQIFSIKKRHMILPIHRLTVKGTFSYSLLRCHTRIRQCVNNVFKFTGRPQKKFTLACYKL